MGLIVLALWEASPFPLTQMEQSLFSWQGPGESLREAGHLRKAPLGSAATTLVRGKQTQPPGLGSGGGPQIAALPRKGQGPRPTCPSSHQWTEGGEGGIWAWGREGADICFLASRQGVALAVLVT